MSDIRLLLTTVPDAGCGVKIISELLSRRQIACGSIIPGLRSLYLWDGKLCDEQECQLILKTSATRVGSVQKTVVEMHPYSTPELLTLNPEQVSDRYRDWILSPTAESPIVEG